VRTRLGRVPRPLIGLLAAVGLLGIAWALAVPPWQVPDEPSHEAYAQTLSERFAVPGDPHRPRDSTEHRLASRSAGATRATGAPAAKPEWSEAAYRRWRALDGAISRAARRDGGGPNRAQANPPLYYAYVALAYRAAYRGDVFDRLYAMRLLSAALLLVTTTATWLLAGELVGRCRPLQLVAAATAGMQPMVAFITASVNPDALLIAGSTLVLWLAARTVNRGLTGANAACLTAATALAIATKVVSYALLPAVALALGVAAWRRRHGLGARAVAVGVAVVGVIALAAIGALSVSTADETVRSASLVSADGASIPGFASYLWQFYLPRLPFQEPVRGLAGHPFFDTWVVTAWAAFGWHEVRFPGPVYLALAAFSLGAVALAAVALRRRGIDPALAGLCALVVLALLLALHWTEFRIIEAGEESGFSRGLRELRRIPLDGFNGNPFMKGRYLLPLVPLAGVAVALAASLATGRRRALAVGVLLAVIVTLQLFSLGLVVARFNA